MRLGMRRYRASQKGTVKKKTIEQDGEPNDFHVVRKKEGIARAL